MDKKEQQPQPKRDKKGKVIVNGDFASCVLALVDKGLVSGLGDPVPGQMCVEAAVAYASGEDHNDNPSCVNPKLASVKIALNDDCGWESDKARAKGLRRVAIAQLGSKGKLNFDKLEAHFEAKANEVLLPKEKKASVAILQATVNNLLIQIKRINKAKSLLALENACADTDADYYDRDTLPNPPDHSEGLGCGYAEVLRRANPKLSQQRSLMLAAEELVQALKKQKIPGTKYLHLTETKAKKKAKK